MAVQDPIAQAGLIEQSVGRAAARAEDAATFARQAKLDAQEAARQAAAAKVETEALLGIVSEVRLHVTALAEEVRLARETAAAHRAAWDVVVDEAIVRTERLELVIQGAAGASQGLAGVADARAAFTGGLADMRELVRYLGHAKMSADGIVARHVQVCQILDAEMSRLRVPEPEPAPVDGAAVKRAAFLQRGQRG